MAPSKCLVIGGGGNLGGHIVRMLLERGAKTVASYDLVPFSGTEQAVQSFVGNISDFESLVAAMQGMDAVFHTASIIDIRPIPSPKMREVNVDGTRTVIEACKAAKVGILVYTSSLEVVSGVSQDGTVLNIDGVDESAPIPYAHHLPYATTKAAAEELVLAAHSPEVLRTVSVRPGYIQGPGSIGLRVEMVRAKTRSDYYVTAKVPAKISTVHPRNAALAHILAADRISEPDVGGQSFFIRDFEANVVDMALTAFQNTPIKPVILPLLLAYVIAWILDRVDRILHKFAALRGTTHQTSDEVLDIRAVNMAYIDIIVSSGRAKRVLGYTPLVSEAECMQDAARWCEKFYASEGTKKKQT